MLEYQNFIADNAYGMLLVADRTFLALGDSLLLVICYWLLHEKYGM